MLTPYNLYHCIEALLYVKTNHDSSHGTRSKRFEKAASSRVHPLSMCGLIEANLW